MFIKKLLLTSNVGIMTDSLNEILGVTDWGDKHQIGLNYRVGATDTWHDAAGSLYDKVTNNFTSDEYSFDQWNKLPIYLMEQLKNLVATEGIKVGRVRFMRLMPKTGLSVHKDREFRYHFVLKTNPHAYIAHEVKKKIDVSDVPMTGLTYHIPCDGSWYKVDTTQVHYVYNGGSEERIHLVVCGEKK
jgi:hypothetical protein